MRIWFAGMFNAWSRLMVGLVGWLIRLNLWDMQKLQGKERNLAFSCFVKIFKFLYVKKVDISIFQEVEDK